jgi:putative membrane protein
LLATSLSGLPAFAGYFAAAIVLTVLFVLAYTAVTPHREITLIRNGNRAAALSMGMSLIGFAFPLASAIYHSASLLDVVIWGLVALASQLLAFWLSTLAVPKLGDSIGAGDVAAGLWVGCVSIAAGLINAACMSY